MQAEDELAAIGIVLGATWNGARAFTPTSGPGLSLMSEFLGFAYFTELPAVLFDVQRVGPSTGMPTRTQQADLLAAAYASHGDTKHVLLFPRDPRECFELAVTAFDLADRLQTPVIVLSDLDIGMNDWLCPELDWDPAYRPDRGKVLSAAELESREGVSSLRRRRRRRHSAAHAARRASARRVLRARLGAQPVRRLHRGLGGVPAKSSIGLTKKWQTAAKLVPEPVIRRSRKGAALGVVADRQLRRCDRGSARSARGQGRPRRLLPHPRFPVRQEGAAVPRAARARVRRRAESRRAAEDAAARRNTAFRPHGCNRFCITAACRWIIAA